VELLKKNGLDYDKHAREGIYMSGFTKIFTAVLAKHRDLFWATSLGLYDLAYIPGLITHCSIARFTSLLGTVFDRDVDVELGLSKLANILRIEREGGAHQAGSDSLLTILAFAKVDKVIR
jgi:CCR4-NOT transcription complex subunit 7/8